METMSIEALREMGGEELSPFIDQALIGFTKTEMTLDELKWIFIKISFKVYLDLQRTRLQTLMSLGHVRRNRIVR